MASHYRLSVNPDVDDYISQQKLFRASVERQFGSSVNASEAITHALGGSIKLYDALGLRREIRRVDAKSMLEIGAFLGFSTRWNLASLETVTLTSVDPNLRHRIFDDPRSHVMVFCADYKDRLEIVEVFFASPSDGPLWDYQNYEPRLSLEDAKDQVAHVKVIREPIGRYDIIFVDGNHDYRQVSEDLLLALQMVEPGGAIVLHDAISWPDVVPAATDVCIAMAAEGVHFDGVSGRDMRDYFAVWWTALLRPDAVSLRRSYCDGLAFVRVAENADQDALACKARAVLNNRAWEIRRGSAKSALTVRPDAVSLPIAIAGRFEPTATAWFLRQMGRLAIAFRAARRAELTVAGRGAALLRHLIAVLRRLWPRT